MSKTRSRALTRLVVGLSAIEKPLERADIRTQREQRVISGVFARRTAAVVERGADRRRA